MDWTIIFISLVTIVAGSIEMPGHFFRLLSKEK